MVARQFSVEDIIRMLTNRDNPKTMDYYFMRFLGVDMESVDRGLDWSGKFTFRMSSTPGSVLGESFYLINKWINRNTKFKSMFVLHMFEDKKLPKSRLLKIVGERSCPVDICNPKKGQNTIINSGVGFVWSRAEPDYISHPKVLVAYSRNSWERRTELKINKDDKETQD